ncbi:MAG: hypothetical protein COX14_04445 [Chloroflexi bacterium CG23_combo_of_CG06-09_8_20_14_all_45_10]|nr:MAG: hypothetical protein COX14_04445 [Chloroflexi bacterium CG23_combo_of_CG06-09_8_20_14_all_45_10]
MLLQPKQKASIEYQKCRPEKCEKGGCLVLSVCPKKLWKQESPYDIPFIVSGFCDECGKCVEACPLKAVRML